MEALLPSRDTLWPTFGPMPEGLLTQANLRPSADMASYSLSLQAQRHQSPSHHVCQGGRHIMRHSTGALRRSRLSMLAPKHTCAQAHCMCFGTR